MDVSFEEFPKEGKTDPEAYKTAIDTLPKGSASTFSPVQRTSIIDLLTQLVTIFTPDTTHYSIALYAIERGIHVLITKPAVKILEHHQKLLASAKEHNVFVYIEHHKRYDPAYADARFRAQKLGDFNYFYSYMSQPK